MYIERDFPSKWAPRMQLADKIEPRGIRGTHETYETHETQRTQRDTAGQSHVSDTSSAAQRPLSTRAGGKDDGS